MSVLQDVSINKYFDDSMLVELAKHEGGDLSRLF